MGSEDGWVHQPCAAAAGMSRARQCLRLSWELPLWLVAGGLCSLLLQTMGCFPSDISLSPTLTHSRTHTQLAWTSHTLKAQAKSCTAGLPNQIPPNMQCCAGAGKRWQRAGSLDGALEAGRDGQRDLLWGRPGSALPGTCAQNYASWQLSGMRLPRHQLHLSKLVTFHCVVIHAQRVECLPLEEVHCIIRSSLCWWCHQSCGNKGG